MHVCGLFWGRPRLVAAAKVWEGVEVRNVWGVDTGAARVRRCAPSVCVTTVLRVIRHASHLCFAASCGGGRTTKESLWSRRGCLVGTCTAPNLKRDLGSDCEGILDVVLCALMPLKHA